MYEEHPFAPYVRILGKGRKGSRGLTQQEAYDSMNMILKGEVEDLQLGAFLMLLRVKEETPEEIAGFVQACRDSFNVPSNHTQIDLDWSSYAGKRRQLPWFILSALLLASNGIRVLMHGTEGHTEGRVYTRDTLKLLGLPVCESYEMANQQIEANNFAYIPLEVMSGLMHDIIQMRPLLGLRSPVHTVARMFNPYKAPYLIQGIFHPTYSDTHQVAAQLIGEQHMAVLKGEGGEIERNPDNTTRVKSVHDGELSEEDWGPLFSGPRHLRDEEMDIARLREVWEGKQDDEYGIASVTGTVAIILKLMGKAKDQSEAQQMAETMWKNRPLNRFVAAA
ncbi:MAG: glycosyl transferase family protein [Gammaproteobacteria bacterium]|nr:glycosyl transferase family protein [Gammaproteobacteria bacterium]